MQSSTSIAYMNDNRDVTGAYALINCNPQYGIHRKGLYGIHLWIYTSNGAFDTTECLSEWIIFKFSFTSQVFDTRECLGEYLGSRIIFKFSLHHKFLTQRNTSENTGGNQKHLGPSNGIIALAGCQIPTLPHMAGTGMGKNWGRGW